MIRAPFNGTVLRKEAEIGEVVAPSVGGGLTRGAVVTMADLTHARGRGRCERGVHRRGCGAASPARITLDAYPDTSFRGEVRQVVPTADRQRATVQVKVQHRRSRSAHPAGDGRAGGFPGGQRAERRRGRARGPPRFRLPAAAVRELDGQTVVWLVRDGRLESRPVQAGPASGGFREIRAGLSGGEQMLVGGVDQPAAGMRVTVENAGSTLIASEDRNATPDARSGLDITHTRDPWHWSRSATSTRPSSATPSASRSSPVSRSTSPRARSPRSWGRRAPASPPCSISWPGLDRPTSGSIRVAGREVSSMTPGQLAPWRAQHIGFVFQNLNLLPVLTAFQNVELPLLLTRLSKKERDERVQARARRGRPGRPAEPLSRASSPAARSSGSRSPAPSWPTPRWCCWTSPPGSSTPRARRMCSACCSG